MPRDTCPDRPCSKYDFLIKDYSIDKLTLEDARRRFIEYFVENGHGYMEPYPVLARWRDDLYLTIASIVVFQPAVTEGIVDPPYNPLVIVQPCIRLEDIDNVGLTFGRHLTSFEMGGHHAFNKKDKTIYWVEETLRHAYRFFTEKIGIPGDAVVFKESWWEGGGNAGPAFEVVVDGLELATLVFMKYRVSNGEYVPNPVMVVDTGYGIERIAWFTQRTPTAFHAIYTDLLEEYKDILSIEEPPHDVLTQIVYVTSDKDFKGPRQLLEYIDKHAQYRMYKEQLRDSIRLYTLLDHNKTIALMLSDGIVPSNTGEGYLARLVIRRMLRTLLLMGFKAEELGDIAAKLMTAQIKYWRNKYVYARFDKYRDYIIDVLLHEADKFSTVVKKGMKIVSKYAKKKRVTLDDLITIYDSHGIPPEIVAEKLREKGLVIEVPENFYSLVAARHKGPVALAKQKEHELGGEIALWADKFPETQRLFHDNPYIRECEARVLGVRDRYIILDKTIFYPKAGGQENDTGVVVTGNGDVIEIKMVYKTRSNRIVHEAERPIEELLKPGDIVKCRINWLRRYWLMRHHTATHIVLGAARRVLGDHVWQAGAEKTENKARLDITHHKMLSDDEIRRIEEEANRIIDEHIDVKIHYLGKFEAEKRYGVKIYEGGAVVAPVLRIVEIPGWDAEACFGTHVANTSEIGAIKIIGVDKIQDGVVRLEYTVATQVPGYARRLEDTIKEVQRHLGGGGDVVLAARKIVEERKKLKELLSEYRRYLEKNLVAELVEKSVDLCGKRVVVVEKNIDDDQLYRSIIINLARRGNIVLYIDRKRGLLEASAPRSMKDIDLRKGVETISRIYSVKGGGKRDHVTLRISTGDPVEIGFELIRAALGCV